MAVDERVRSGDVVIRRSPDTAMLVRVSTPTAYLTGGLSLPSSWRVF
jgi:hypothetical protein